VPEDGGIDADVGQAHGLKEILDVDLMVRDTAESVIVEVIRLSVSRLEGGGATQIEGFVHHQHSLVHAHRPAADLQGLEAGVVIFIDGFQGVVVVMLPTGHVAVYIAGNAVWDSG